MIIVEGQARLAPGEVDRLRDAMRAQIEASRAEPGCLHYSYAVDVLDPTLLRITELWADQESLEAHFRTPHMAAFNKEFTAARVESVKVKAHETELTRTLIDR